MNLRSYYPDFVAIDSSGQHWLIETKGMESGGSLAKRRRGGKLVRKRDGPDEDSMAPWVKVPQKGYEALQPKHFADLEALAPTQTKLLGS